MSSTGGPAPRLRTRRATPDDAGAIARIHFEAFGPGVMNRLMHPNGVSEDARAKFAGAVFPPPDKAADPSAEIIVMVAELLPEASEAGGGAHGPAIVAFAKWRLVREAQPREEWEGHGEMTEGQLGEGADAAVYNEFIGGLHRMRQRWVKGDPCLRELSFPADVAPDWAGDRILTGPHRSGNPGYHAYPSRARGRVSLAQVGLRAR